MAMEWQIVVLCVLLFGACGVIFVLWSRLRFIRHGVQSDRRERDMEIERLNGRLEDVKAERDEARDKRDKWGDELERLQHLYCDVEYDRDKWREVAEDATKLACKGKEYERLACQRLEDSNKWRVSSEKWKNRGLRMKEGYLEAMTADRNRWRQTAQDLAGKLTEAEKERDVLQDDVVRLKDKNKHVLDSAMVAEEEVRKVGELLGC